MEQAVLKEILAVPDPLTGDMLKPASSSNESAKKKEKKVHLHFLPLHLEYGKVHWSGPAHLSDSVGQDLDDLVMWCSNNTLPVYFNNAMPNTNTSSFCDTTTHQTADLPQGGRR